MAVYIFTCGDVNGIGPEIAYKTLKRAAVKSKDSFIFIVPVEVISVLERNYGQLPCQKFNVNNKVKPGISILNPGSLKPGKGMPTREAGEISFSALEFSFALLKEGIGDAVITAPISKTSISMAGINFPGQTEMFAQWCGVKDYLMTFLSKNLNAALHTIHIPIKDVPAQITIKKLSRTLAVLTEMLQRDLGIIQPRIAVLGLNPHAGENGLIGREELNVITPFIKSLAERITIHGPHSPDAFFAGSQHKNYDMVLGMYHDQVLIPFKQMNFDKGVNYTAGLPIVRTSPDHGTAFDIAWKDTASESSMMEAFRFAKKIVQNRKKHAAR